MQISISEYVLMATQAYYYYRAGGEQSQTLEDAGFVGWTQVAQITDDGEPRTGFSATVFEKDGEYVVAFRGTDDWREDFGDAEYNPTLSPGQIGNLAGAGGVGEQTRRAIQYVEKILAETGATTDNISFTGHSLGGALAGIAGAYFDAPAVTFDPAQYIHEVYSLAVRLEVIANYLFLGTPLEGLEDDVETFHRYISQIDPDQYPVKGRDEFNQEFVQNVTRNTSVYRVQGEILDLFQPFETFEDYQVAPGSYTRIDLGDSDQQNNYFSTTWDTIALSFQTNPETGEGPDNRETRRLHHISAMVLAVLGWENHPSLSSGAVEVFRTLQQQPDLLTRVIDEDLTALESFEGDNEERLDYKLASHGNFWRVLNLHREFGEDFSRSFDKTDNSDNGVESIDEVVQDGIAVSGAIIGSTSGGGANNVSGSLLESDPIRRSVMDLGMIIARKIAARLNGDTPANLTSVGYDKSKILTDSIFGNDEHSIAISFEALTTPEDREHDLTGAQTDRLNLALAVLRLGLNGSLNGFANAAKLNEFYDLASVDGTDSTLVFGSIANGNSNFELESGFGIFLGGNRRDVFTGDDLDDYLFGGVGNDVLKGEGGADYIEGGKGNDWLDGGTGNDAIFGGSGDDVFVAEIGDGTDVFDGGRSVPSLPFGGGTDTVAYRYFSGDAEIRIGASNSNASKATDFGIQISEDARGRNGEAGGFDGDTLESIELASVEAGDGNDTLIIDANSEVERVNYIDLGGQQPGGVDTIDFSSWDEDVTVDLTEELVSWIDDGFGSGLTDFIGLPNLLDDTLLLEVRGAEKVLAGSGSDVLLAGVDFNNIPFGVTGAFQDRLEEDPGNEASYFARLRDAIFELLGFDEPDDTGLITSSDFDVDFNVTVELFGGEGDDAIFVSAGDRSKVVGGDGSDLLYNSSYKGELWGDGLDGKGVSYSGDTNDDTFWWSAGSFIMDAGKNDRLQLFGFPLVGGTNESYFGASLEKNTARDFFLPWVTYGMTEKGQLLVDASLTGNLSLDMSEDEILQIAQVVENWDPGDLGIEFSIFGGEDNISLFRALFQYIGDFRDSANRFVKNRNWLPADDPLVLDLNGDGLVSRGIGAVYWDNDGDLFGEKSGWLSGDDGFLVHDADGDGSITAPELFGGPGLSGFTELTDWDSNDDGIVNADDVNFGDLQIWRDANENGITDAGELHDLAAFGVTAFSVRPQPVDIETANGTIIRAESFYAREDGTTGALGELIFETDRGSTKYLGDERVAAFAPKGVDGETLDAFGYGITTDLAVAASNDLALAEIISNTAGAMVTADLDVLRDQARTLLGTWARSNADSRELGAALVGSDGALIDHAVYNEDAQGGYWTLASGDDVLSTDGSVIPRASFEDVLAQTASNGAAWQIVQGWSPSDRDFTSQDRQETAYLIGTGASADVLDYAIRQSDAGGAYWTLASGADVIAADGSVIERASLADIMAQGAADGSEWRMEGFADPQIEAPFDKAAFYIRDGIVTDYSVWVEDGDGVFAIWASNLQRALDSQEVYGPGQFGLRGFALDLDTLPDADNSDDSAVRVEIMTVDEVHYAFASVGEEFRPELFVANSAPDNTLDYTYDIADNTEFASLLVDSYLAIGRAMAVRIASQGGLAEYFQGVEYDPATDTFQATSGRELEPLFTAILTDAPAGAEEVVDYLRDWDRILQTVYPDFKRHGKGPRSQAFLFHMVVAGFENAPVDASFLQVAEALSIDEERVLVADDATPDLEGTRGNDLIYVADGATAARGGLGSDTYVIGRDFGAVTIQDVEPILQPGSSDYLRFAHLTPDDVYVTKDGADLIIQEIGTDNILTIRDQFEGRWPGIFGGDFSDNTEITEIVFADGTAWDFVDMAYAASHPLATDDVVLGTEAIDVLDGGAGNDVLRGGGDSDLYIFGYGYGEDRIVDGENNPFRNGIDIVAFKEGIDADRLSFERVGDSNDLIIHLLDQEGVRTGDILTIEGQFFQQDAFITTLKPNLVEMLVFQDGTFLDEQAIRERVLAEARTDGEDAIWAFDEAETLDGGAGDDVLVGQNGADTYIFARGYGDDVIQDQSFEVGIGVVETPNTLRLQGINAADVEVLREHGSPTVSLRIKDTGETVTLKNQFRVTYAFWTIYEDNVDFIEFGDGTVWDQDRLNREVLALESTEGNNHIIGFDWADTLDGGAGNDLLEGGLYNDTYVFAAGYGQDTVFDTAAGRHPLLPAGYDMLDLRGITLQDVDFSRSGTDLTLTLRATGDSVTLAGQYDRLSDTVVEDINFDGFHVDWRDLGADDIDLVGTSGDDILIGTHYAEVIDGRAGNDILRGSSDGDTYLFDIGYGQDVIDDTIDFGKWRAADTVRFGADVSFADVSFTRDGDDLLIAFEGFSDSLRVADQFGSVLAGVEVFEFADGNVLTIEDVEELLQISGGTRGDNILTGFDDRANILDGRQGDDQLIGGSFGDTYLFGVGYDFDTITEKRDSESVDGAVDRVVFGRLVDPADVLFRADGTNLIVTIPSSGEQLTIVDGLGERQIEQFDFYDGTVWDPNDIRAALVRGTDGDDLLIGFDNFDDILDGGQGSDLLVGKGGNDTYRFGLGDGLDAIEDSAGIDRLELDAGISIEMLRFEQVDDGLLIRLDGFDDSLLIRDGLADANKIESIVLSDGFELEFEDVRNALIAQQTTTKDDVVTGFAGRNDTLDGGAGNDELKGLTGDDVYIIGENPGLDIVSDTGGLDRVSFSVGRSDRLQVRRLDPSSGDIAISFAGLTGETIIRGAIDGAGRIEEYQFADGELLTLDDMRALVIDASSSDGNDFIQGFGDAAAPAANFDGGRGDDIIIGQANGDNYVFRRLDGADTIIDTGAGIDVLRIEGYSPEDVTFERLHESSLDVLVTFAGTQDQIILRGQDASATSGIEQIVFGNGEVIDHSTIAASLAQRIASNYTGGDINFTGSGGSQTLLGGPGDDSLNNGSNIDRHTGNDILIGGEGNDWMRGGGGNDTYSFSAGFGRDTINEGLNWRRMGYDRIEFDETISPDQIRLSRSSNGNDLILEVKGTHDRIYVTYGVGNGGRNTNTGRIEEVRFADGTVWSWAQMMGWTDPGTTGDETIYGIYAYGTTLDAGDGNDSIYFGRDIEYDTSNDILIGGGGNDYLRGGRGNDIYRFSVGFGQDVINEGTNFRGLGTDRIEFDATISAEDVEIIRLPNDFNSIVLQVKGTGDRIRIGGGIGIHRDQDDYRIESVRFADGTIWSYAEMLEVVLGGTAGDDTIYGAFAVNNLLDGGAGNDTLYFGGNIEYQVTNDTFVGGEGNDWMRGGRGNDTYRFSAGFGHDTISEGYNFRGMGTDALEFDESITRDLLSFAIDGDNLIVRVDGTEDQIMIVNGAYNTDYRIESARFADGTSMSYAEMIAAVPTGDTDTGNLIVNGDFSQTGPVIGTFSWGIRQSSIPGWTDATGQGFEFWPDGNDSYWLDLEEFNAHMDISQTVTGLAAGTQFQLNFDYMRRSYADTNSFDVLWNDQVIATYDVEIGDWKTANFIVTAQDGDNALRFRSLGVATADGVSLDNISLYALGSASNPLLVGTEGNDDLAGSNFADRILGGLGNDTLSGGRNRDTLEGDEGNDTLLGGTGDDTLEGGLGDDIYEGGEDQDRQNDIGGNDTYRFNLGDGRDVIDDASGLDRIEFGAGITAADVLVTATSDRVSLRIGEEGDVIHILGGHIEASGLIETVAFADGTEWTAADLLARYNAARDDFGYYRGTQAVETLDGGRGDDTIVAVGSGDTLLGGEGNDSLQGNDDAQILDGGLGDDTLDGAGGDDTYRWGPGDGQDIVTDTGGSDLVEIAAGISPDMLKVRRSGNDLIILSQDNNSRLTLKDALLSTNNAIETIRFADGTEWLPAELLRRSMLGDDGGNSIEGTTDGDTIVSGAGNDTVNANDGDDVIDGGLGNDQLNGGLGNDTYVWRLGDGEDRIDDAGGIDTIEVDASIARSDITILRTGTSAVELRVAGTTDRLILIGVLADAAKQIETIRFADGSEISHADLVAAATLGTPLDDVYRGLETDEVMAGAGGNDRIFGNGGNDTLRGDEGDDRLDGAVGNDTLTGGIGSDLLLGGSGNDTYIYAIGDGRDVVIDGSGADKIQISGASASDMKVRRFEEGNSDLLLDFGNGSSILIVGGIDAATAIETVEFTDTAETLSAAQLVERAISDRATNAGDYVTGTAGDDRLVGGLGDDILAGGVGDDTYVFASGDGRDRIVDTGGVADMLLLTDYVFDDIASLFRSPPAGHDLVIEFANGDQIILADALLDGDAGVDRIEFADGSEIAPVDLRADLLAAFDNASDARIWGFSGNDTLAGGAGSDELHGLDGDDTYIFRAGDGHDTIEDNGGGNDRLIIEDYASTDARLSRLYYGSSGASLGFIGASGDSLTLVNLTEVGEDQIESIEFADGVVWDLTTIETLVGNNAPVANPDGFRDVVQGTVLQIGADSLLSNDFDADGDALNIQAIGEVTGGTAVLLGDGTIEFTADPDFTGIARISYVIADGRQGFGDGEISVRVRPVVVANDDSGIAVAEDASIIIRDRALLANDVDGDRMEIAQVKDAVNGTVSLSSTGDITFTPDADFNGVASFTYVANTPEGGRDEALVEIDVIPVNDGPIARNDASGLATDEGVPLLIDATTVAALLNNDSDIDGDALSIAGVAGNANTNAELNPDGSILLSPIGDYFGQASFTYFIEDGQGGSANANVSFAIRPVNDAPVTQGETFTIDEDNPLFISGEELTANDYDPDGVPVTITAVNAISGGSVELFENNTVLFDPNTNFNGTAYFSYTLDDGEGGVTTQQVAVEINPVNDVPTARNDRPFGPQGRSELITAQDEVLVIDPAIILGNDYDIDSASFALETVSFAENGSVELGDDGLIYFTPDEGYWGFGSFRYVISDDDNAVDDGEVSVYFRPTGNVAPVAIDDSFTGTEDELLIIAREDLIANDFDPNGDAIEIIGSVTKLGASARQISDWYWNEEGDLVVVPLPDLPGSATLFYTITDGTFTDEGRIDVNFAPAPDAPTAVDDIGFASGLGRPLVLRVSDLKDNDYDIDESIWLPSGGWAHQFGAANADILDQFSTNVGSASIYGDEFIVVEFDPTYSGDITLGYTLSDQTGLSGDATATGTISTERDLLIEGTEIRDLLIGSEDAETIVGLDGQDDLYGRGGDDILRGGDGADLLDGGEGFDIADYSDSLVAMRVDINSRIGQGGFAEGDELVSIEGIIGGSGSDQLFGNEIDNTLVGGASDDALHGRDGADTLAGDAGDDTLIGGAGADALDGGEGVDTADYADSAEAVTVSLANGTASGGDAEGDSLSSIENVTGSIGDDVLDGDAQDNELVGGRGDDAINGGAGDDLIEGGRGADNIDGGEGIDTARYWLSDQGVSIDLEQGTAAGGEAEGDQLTGVENIIGSAHDDTIVGDAEDNIIEGGAGADALDGGAGNDTADYNDSVDGVTVDLAAGSGSGGDATGDTLTNFENVRGSLSDDAITGDAGDNILDGSRGDDTLTGALGSDTYILANGSGRDTIFEGASPSDTDVLRIDGDYGPDAVSIYADGNDLVVELEQDDGFLSDLVRIKDHFLGDGAGIESIVFGDGTSWDRATIDANSGAGRLQAVADIVRWADEDQPFTFAAADLLINDEAPEGSVLSVISVEAVSDGSVILNDDNTITFAGDLNFNGDGYFRYRMADENGRVSSGLVEVNVRPVNDAPEASDDGGFVMNEDEVLSIPVAWLLANDIDIDGDALVIDGFERVDGGNGEASTELAGFVSFRPDADYFGNAAFRYRASDGNGGEAWAEVSVEVRPVNDGPRAAGDSASVRSGRDMLISVASLLSNDVDPEGDAFEFSALGDAVNGTAVLEDVNGQQMIRFTPDDDYVGSANFTYSIVEQATGLADSATVSVTVLPPNDPPIAIGETLAGLEDTPLVIAQAELLANDSDPNGDVLSVSRIDDFPEQGSVAFDGDGNIVFTPAENYNGPASFRYWVSDGEFEREATASINVAPVNDAPVVVDDAGPFIGDEDKVLVLRAADLFGNDSDAEGDLLEFAEFETNVGTITKDGFNLLLTPPLNYNGPITVRYRASDEKGAVSEDWASVTVEITDIPDKPVAVADSFATDEDTPLVLDALDLIGNDTDADGSTLRLIAVENAVGGEVVLEGGTVTFTPDPDYFGSATFDYVVTDDEAGSVTGNATVEIASVNDAPRVTSDVFETDEDVTLTLAPSAFLANDIDPDGDTISIVAVEAITEGASATIEVDGSISLTPPQDTYGLVRFNYTVSDETGLDTTGLVSLFVASVNDLPIANNDGPLVLAEDSVTLIAVADLLANDTDVDGDALSFSLIDVDGGTASIVGDFVRFEPAADYNGSGAIHYQVDDGNGGTAVASLSLEIQPVNDAPTVALALGDQRSAEDASFAFAIDPASFSDVDGDVLTLSASLENGSDLPTWLSFDGTELTGTPPVDFNGALSIEITASDGELSVSSVFTLAIDAVNDAPAILTPLADFASDEDASIDIAVPLDGIVDVDGDTLNFTVTQADGSDLPDWLEFTDGRLVGAPPANFNGILALQLVASDGELSVGDPFALRINAVNDAPVVTSILPDVSSDEDTAFAFAIPADSFSDVDGDSLTLAASLADGSELPDWIGFDGSQLTGTPPADFSGSLDITISASDGELVASSTFTLSIDAINDAPVLLAPLADQSSAEDTTFSFAVPDGTFADVDGDILALGASLADGSDLPAWLNFNGSSFAGTPPQDFNGTLELLVTASDGEFSASSAFDLTIDAVNDAPVVLTPLSDQTSPEDAPFAFVIPANTFADVDGDALTTSASLADGSDLPDWLSFDGVQFAGTPPLDFNGSLAVTVTATDGTLDVSENFALDITPVNDAPEVDLPLADVELQAGDGLTLQLDSGIFSDIDGDSLTLTATLSDGSALPDWLVFDGQQLVATTQPDFNETLDITVTADDGELSVSDEFTLSVISSNTAPDAVDDGVFVTTSNRELIIDPLTLLDNDSDVNGDVLEITSVGNAVGGEVSFGDDGNIVFIPDAVFVGAAEFTYTVSDGALSSEAIVSLQIDPSDQFDAWRQGNDNRNFLFGSLFGRNRIFGAGGNDYIVGGFGSDDLAGGDGNDRIFGLWGNDDLWGGQGDDLLFGGFGFDTAHLLGYRDSYSIETQGGFLSLRISDNAVGADGDDGVDQLSSIERLAFKGGETLNLSSPIILDLAGDGIETLSAAESDAKFDLDGDGLADDTSWIGSGEGFLYLDRNGDGTMSDASEISFIDDLPDAASDLAGLRAFDSNGDGVLDGNDERFTEFGVWRDGDGDGAVDAGETATLIDIGIASINLTGTAVDGTTEFGEVAIINTGSYTLTNGVTREFADAALTYFSAATNMPELEASSYTFGRKSKKYRLTISNGGISVGPKKQSSGIDPLAGRLGANTVLNFTSGSFTAVGMFAPVVLDLDGDGIELVERKKSQAVFDYKGDNIGDDTGWVSGDDGFLVIDRDNDGVITEASELTLAAEDSDARTGLQGLAALDSDGNGVVNGDDARFGELRIWQDRNGNGRTDAGELRTLEQAGVVSIALTATALESRIKLDRNAMVATTSFTRSDGTTSTAADVSLAYVPTGSVRTSGRAFQLSRVGTDYAPLPSWFNKFAGNGAFGPASGMAINSIFDRMMMDPDDRLLDLFDAFDPAVESPIDPSLPPGVTQVTTTPATAIVDESGGENADQTEPKRLHVMPESNVLLEDETSPSAPLMPGSDAELSRRLSILRQGMATFGEKREGELDRMAASMPPLYDWYV